MGRVWLPYGKSEDVRWNIDTPILSHRKWVIYRIYLAIISLLLVEQGISPGKLIQFGLSGVALVFCEAEGEDADADAFYGFEGIGTGDERD